MSNFKSSLILAFLSFGMISINPAMGQSTISTLDFWLTFAELLTGDLLTDLSKAELPNLVPNIPIPSLPSVVLPNIVIPDINLSGLSLPAVPAPPASAPAPTPQTNVPYYYYGPNSPFSLIIPTTTAAPSAPPTSAPPAPSTTTRQPDGCEPEKVRIIVVSDCDDKKPQESSESSESSEEAHVIVPYQKRGRYHFQKPSKH